MKCTAEIFSAVHYSIYGANFIFASSKTRVSAFHVRSIFHDDNHFMREAHFIKGDKRLMSNNILVDYSMDFSVLIVNICDGIKGKSALTNQLLRSGTSIGANIYEANYAQSKADFVSKLQIALKECYESEYWLELFSKTNMISSEAYAKAKNDCGKIRRMLISSINTTKEKYQL